MNPALNSKIKAEDIDCDYWQKLDSKEKDFLNQFNEEWNNGRFRTDRKPLHGTKEQELECYDRTNHRNKDVHAKAKARGKLDSLAEVDVVVPSTEDTLNEFIDAKNGEVSQFAHPRRSGRPRKKV